MRKPSRRKCKVCGEYFVPKFHDIRIRWCCPEHGAILAMEEREKEKVKAAAKRIKEQKEAEKVGRQRRKAKRESLKSKSQWDKEAQSAFNRYIRIRDEGKPCVSCGNPLIGKSNYLTGSAIDASHYRSRGAASHLKFNVFNVHSACTRCNRQLSGNAVEYRIRLIERIGLERVERLEADYSPRRFDVTYLKRVKAIFSRRANALMKRRQKLQESAA
ncbi:recombination protein NinG [Enterobacter hormaechei]|nr:recombination protein NinG [Enterobacter hormaechei]KJO94244.1 bacteriophage Lambda NinG protein [Enterobacter hormaechei subsp. xiangfangensis]MCL8101765.1 recombination protein NinG [Enterobacter hormaechei]MCL8105625.1 recombination protein NinG [Enterobacter hormaechei]MCM8309338.1 recombination protein NinG [Enterobacter hormaechei]MCM8380179.1 recombination protein NinG [Enterobacter hormaechei]